MQEILHVKQVLKQIYSSNYSCNKTSTASNKLTGNC